MTLSRPRPVVLLALSVGCLSLGIFMHLSMNVNFIHEILHGSSWQQGYLEAIRETQGILSFFVIALLAGRSEPKIAAVMLVITGMGLAAYSLVATIPQLVMASLFWSFGFHAWVPVSGSMQLALAKRGHEGRALGWMGAVGAAGVLLGLGSVWVLTKFFGFGLRQLFFIAGSITALGALPLLFIPTVRTPAGLAPDPRKFLAPKYRLYGLLEFLDGMRKQIFFLFAVLALVREHGVAVPTIAALMFANQVIMIALAPAAGRWVDRVGERPVLIVYFTGFVAAFILYATLTDVTALCAVYMADSGLGALRIGIITYAKRLAPAAERTRLLAWGVTLNHVGAVTLPLVGGALYAAYGYRFPFWCGALIAAGSIFVARRLPARPVPAVRRVAAAPAD